MKIKKIKRNNNDKVKIDRADNYFTEKELEMTEQTAFEILNAFLAVKHNKTYSVFFKCGIVITKGDLTDISTR